LCFKNIWDDDRWHETLGISLLLTYQGTTNFDARTKARMTNAPRNVL